jgi:uncharacterized protein (DUF4415 family)
VLLPNRDSSALPQSDSERIYSMKLYPVLKEFEEGHGFTREDWDAVDFPELTDEELAQARPFKEVFPELFASIQAEKLKRGERGKQKAPVKTRVTLRLDAEIVDAFKATGAGWQSRINDQLKQSLPV